MHNKFLKPYSQIHTHLKMAIVFWFSLLLLLAVQSNSSFVCEDYTDCRTLAEFKNGVTSDPGDYLRAWNEANPFCNWTGVTCHRDLQNRVVSLLLDGRRLEGSLSPSLSNLSFLTTLSLTNNTFNGEIPSSYGDLSELTHLNLSYNKLQGPIPASLRGCRSLKLLDLTRNNFSGVVPKELWTIKSLTDLCLSLNRLTGPIPSSLSNLTELKRLELSFNYFTGEIPPEIGQLRKLEILYFHTNYFEGPIPSAISNCTALREISVGDNKLNGEIPADIGAKMRNLQWLYLLMNKLTGKIPVNLSNISGLILFDVSWNELVGEVPMEFGRLKNLQILYLHSNYFVSSSDNSSLRFLTALTNCTKLQKLHLGSSFFSGKLPDSIGSLSKDLFYFNLIDNRISGSIPESIGNLTGLVTLIISFNVLDGNIPSSFGKVKQLQRLNLHRNKLVGTIPSSLGEMASLGLLDVGKNSISGAIPPSLCDSGKLGYLDLSLNRLSGNFPVELVTRCSVLLLLDLSHNEFRGLVPTEIGSISNLALFLNLSNNNFEGRIPEAIGSLRSVQAIDFSNNNFSGVIPSSIGSCTALQYLNLSNNMFEGSIPESLKRIAFLESLDLSQNQLNGTFPSWIGTNDKIKFLNLSYNRLSGEVPGNGSLRNFNLTSFMGNVGLCGGSTLMGLPQCESQHKKGDIMKVVYPILIVIFGIMIIMALAYSFRYFVKKREVNQESIAIPVPSNASMRWARSYTERELEIATNGFSEDNLLGRGGVGSVYKAVMDSGRTIVAVKVFNEDSAQSLKSLKRECEILSGIKHRNLLRVLGLCWSPHLKALVLEFIPNGNLDQHLYPHGNEEDICELTLEARLSIAIDIANGLEYLQLGCPTQIVHCDLKPQNVLIDNDLVAHIADFGIGKLLFDGINKQASTTGFLRGSIGYIPPEYAQGLGVSAKGDIYSYGIMLLETITRKRPTSDMFRSGLDLRKWVHSSFPKNTLDVVDTALKHNASFEGSCGSLERFEQCCTRVLNVGLMCTEKDPYDRPGMSSVVQMLLSIAKDEDPDDKHEPKGKNRSKEEEMSILHDFV